MRRDFLTIKDVGRRLNLSYERVYKLVRCGALPFVRRGGRWVSPVRAWERWLDLQAEQALANSAGSVPRESEPAKVTST